MSWRTLMAYFVLSPNGEESLNKLLGPDLDSDTDHLRWGPSHGYNTCCRKKSKSVRAKFLSYASRQTYIKTQIHYLHTPIPERGSIRSTQHFHTPHTHTTSTSDPPNIPHAIFTHHIQTQNTHTLHPYNDPHTASAHNIPIQHLHTTSTHHIHTLYRHTTSYLGINIISTHHILTLHPHKQPHTTSTHHITCHIQAPH